MIGNGDKVFREQWFVIVSRLPVSITLLMWYVTYHTTDGKYEDTVQTWPFRLVCFLFI